MKLTGNFCSGVVGFSSACVMCCSFLEERQFVLVAGLILLIACIARVAIYSTYKE